MISLRTLVLFAAFALAAPAFADQPAPVAQPGSDDVAQFGASSTITVTSTGAEPRTPLRYNLDALSAQTLVMDMTMAMSMDMGFGQQQQAMPTMRMTTRFGEPTAVGDDRRRVSFDLDSFDVVDTPGVDPAVTAVMRQSMAQMGTMSGWMVIDDRGQVHDGDMSLTGGDPMVAEQLGGMSNSIEQMSVPFPEEPVGVGASWDARMDLEMNGISISQTATYTVMERTDTYVRLAMSLTQTASTQSITDPSMPGMTVNLLSFSSTGSGTATMFYDRMVPDSDMTLRTEMSMSVDGGGGQAMPMSMTNDMTMTMRAQ